MEPEVIIKELEILNPRLRQIAELALESSKGLKNAQLAEIMDTTEAAIFTAKSRIIKQLKAPRGEKVPSKWDAYWEGTSPEERAADLARVEARWPDTDRREIAEMLLGSDEEPPKTPNAIADIKDTTADNIRAKKSQILHLLSPRKA
jgi:DNA-binding CsgD family transcriptional regulator